MPYASRLQVQDSLLPFAVVSVVAMMVFPLPSAALDALLMCNISFSLALLVSTVYLTQPERFTSLPTILLLSTLFRLGLNISTTRQILGSGSAPDIVAAFGEFVVSGNVVVGLVIFSIVTLVQFLVIAKGAERVAEVAARFTLDAMPGKQMAIDADVRAGILTLAEARERRFDLHRESRLYGALDGAMKFVKGDAIAGVLITLINISAGLLLGVTKGGLSVGEALSRYTIFTVGDGLVSQIPALLVSVSAGIAVTRVADKDGTFVSRDVFRQIGREPQALLTTGVLLAVLALAPGLPSVLFLSMAVLFFSSGRRLQADARKEEAGPAVPSFRPKVYAPVVFRMSAAAAGQLQREGRLLHAIADVRRKIFEDWGVFLQEPQVDFADQNSGVCVRLVMHGIEAAVITPSGAERLTEALAAVLQRQLEGRLTEFMDDTQTRILLEIHEPVCEDLINSVVPAVLPVTMLTRLLRSLLREKVAITEMRTILQAAAEFCSMYGRDDTTAPATSGLKRLGREELLESAVRRALGRQIVEQYKGRDGGLRVWEVSPALDRLLSEIVMTALEPEPEFAAKLAAAAAALGARGKESGPVVILAAQSSRRLLSRILRDSGGNAAVLDPEEIPVGTPLEVRGELALLSGGSPSAKVPASDLCAAPSRLSEMRSTA